MKRLTSFIISIIMVISVFLITTPLTVHADSLYIRKVVAVVYDDSGSMKSDNKWPFANYAMQTFCGMLNSEDRLFISYMSEANNNPDYESEIVDLSTDHIQSSIETIKNHTEYGQTPFAAVQAAYNRLMNTPDSNPNTEYWLVILTDGEFNDGIIQNSKEPDELTEKFEEYISTPMPNGSNVQITYFAIGNGATKVPSQEDKGIHTYSCAKDSEIIQTMSDIADKISGRTRLDTTEITALDDRTIQFSSSISLLNIAVLAQKTGAKIVSATYSNEVGIPISRQAELGFSEFEGKQFPDLNSSAYLLGDTSNIIGSGTYKIVFDKPVQKEDVVVLFEPALETRIKVLLNGKEITDMSELSDTSEKDKITVSCALYEMNSDKRIDPSLLPNNTSYDIYIFEDDDETEHVSGFQSEIKDYILKNKQTKIKASVQIENFNPIEYTKKFTPKAYVPPDVYTITASHDGGVKSIKYDDVAQNADLKIRFTVSINGEVIKDPDIVRSLNPIITVSLDGNEGETKIENDGSIVFTPNKAKINPGSSGHYDVDVTCTIDTGTSKVEASEAYSVLLSEYAVIPKGSDAQIRKTEFYDNKIGASFNITKDGQQLDKAQIGTDLLAVLNEQYKDMDISIEVDDDGTIHCVPSLKEEREYSFLTWWGNWVYYFGLPEDNVTITLSHKFGTAEETIEVIHADIGYIIGWVIAPLLTEILLIALIAAYIIRYVTKPRFAKNAVIYIGNISYVADGIPKHKIYNLKRFELSRFNKFIYLWNPFIPLTVGADKNLPISVSAAKGCKIICNSPFPWYIAAELESKERSKVDKIDKPKDLYEAMNRWANKSLLIKEILPKDVIKDDKKKSNKKLIKTSSTYYCVGASVDFEKGMVKGVAKTIRKAKIFCYTAE